MARGGRARLELKANSLEDVLQTIVTNVDRGTKKATTVAAEEIYLRSLFLAPRDTDALYNSAFYEVQGNYKTGFRAVVGYGKPGNINSKSGKEASEYMVEVHEDLQAYHSVGQAKFLETAVREYQADAGSRLKKAFEKHVFSYMTGGFERQ